MKKLLASLVVLMSVACGQGEVVWKDANGKKVATGDDLVFIGAHGEAWKVFPDSGQVQDALAWQIYLSTDCTGEAFVNLSVPEGFAFRPGGETGYRVMPGTEPSHFEGNSYEVSPGKCKQAFVAGPAYRLSNIPATPGIEKPAATWSAPITQELE
jgi:hypothetical protein